METPVLNEVELPIWTTRTCQRRLGYFEHKGKNYTHVFTDDMICAGDEGKAACIGDTGSPLMVYNETSKLWTMVGISSNGFGCGLKNLPDIYVKVSKYLPFLSQSVQRCKPRKAKGGAVAGRGINIAKGKVMVKKGGGKLSRQGIGIN